MRLLIVGDPHLKASNIDLAKRFLGWILDTCRSEKPDLMVFLGDMFHTHQLIRSEVMAIVTQHVIDITSVAPCITLVGNHDMASPKNPEVHAWLPFIDRYKGFKVIDRPKLNLAEASFIPYIDSPDEFQEVLEKAMCTHRLIFCHQTFRGADYGFITTKEGAIVPKDYDGLIVAGHIHKSQRLGPVWYPGTPFAQESADAGQVKGINLLDTVSLETTFIRSPLPQWVTLSATPDNYEQVVSSMSKGDRNHLVLTGSSQELRALMDTKTFRDLKKEYGFSVKRQDTPEGHSSTRVRKVTTLEGAVTDYVDNIYQGNVDKDTLKARCLDALK